jgi:hypothetical protein
VGVGRDPAVCRGRGEGAERCAGTGRPIGWVMATLDDSEIGRPVGGGPEVGRGRAAGRGPVIGSGPPLGPWDSGWCMRYSSA